MTKIIESPKKKDVKLTFINIIKKKKVFMWGDELEPRPRANCLANHVLKDGPGLKMWIGVKKSKSKE